MNLSKSIKNSPLAYIAMKSKASPKKISMYKKIYSRIKNLELIDKDKYVAVHDDCKVQNMDVNLHYLYYGVKDDLATQQSYITDVFNLEFYKSKYGVDNPVFDYVLDGFLKTIRLMFLTIIMLIHLKLLSSLSIITVKTLNSIWKLKIIAI